MEGTGVGKWGTPLPPEDLEGQAGGAGAGLKGLNTSVPLSLIQRYH